MTIYSPQTPLCEILKSSTSVAPLAEVVEHPDQNKAEWGSLLMACTREQIEALKHLWSIKFEPDDPLALTFLVIVQRGFFLDFLKPEDRTVYQRLKLCHACVDNGLTVGANIERDRHKASRPKRR